MLATTTTYLRTLSHGMHRLSEKMWAGHKGQILRNKRHFILRECGNAEHFASAEWKLILLWSAVPLVQCLPSEVNHAPQILSGHTVRSVQHQSRTSEPKRFTRKSERSSLRRNAGMHANTWAMKTLAVQHVVSSGDMVAGSHIWSCNPAVTLLLFLATLFSKAGSEQL